MNIAAPGIKNISLSWQACDNRTAARANPPSDLPAPMITSEPVLWHARRKASAGANALAFAAARAEMLSGERTNAVCRRAAGLTS